MSKEPFDKIENPSHYAQHKIEHIDLVEAWFCTYDYYLGNVLKYIARYRYKGTPKEDLEKALWYLKRRRKIQPFRITETNQIELTPGEVGIDWELPPMMAGVLLYIYDFLVTGKEEYLDYAISALEAIILEYEGGPDGTDETSS